MSYTELHEAGDPTLVLLHGTGGNEREMLEFGRRLAPRYGRLSLLGKEPEGSVNRWFRRFGEGVFDEPNLKMRAAELGDYVVERLPDTRRVALGFSNGANVAAAALLLRPDAFDAAVLLAPMVPFSPEALPYFDGKPILMVCGEQDPIVPRANAQALATMFETAGADLTLHWHPGGHGLGSAEMNVVASFLARYAAGV